MIYKTGDKISRVDILARFRDEDDVCYLEIKGDKVQLYRVGDDDILFFKIDKTDDFMQRLKMVEDYRSTEDYTEHVDQAKRAAAELEQSFEPSDEITLKIDLVKVQKKLAEMAFEEGEKIPDGLKKQCKKSEYGGYSLQFNNFIYILDPDFRVQNRRPVTAGEKDLSLQAEEQIVPPQKIEQTVKPGIKKEFILDKGDVLPEHLRSRCEVDLSTGVGYRIEMGNVIYILDENYRVIVKMSQSHHIAEETVAKAPLQAEEDKKQDGQPQPEKIIDSVLKKFQIALKADKVNAEIFAEQVMAAENKAVLLRVFQGDLAELNEETKAAAGKGKITRLNEGGITLLKAALLHELYLKSTFRGRGEHIIEFLTHIISPWKDTALTITQEDSDREEQEELVEMLADKRRLYRDIGEALLRFYMEMKETIYEEYRQVQKAGKTLFKAFLIDRLYEKIPRPEKG
ncbi:MAG: hypothetical protein L0Y73_01605, partial [Candidatus Aminicenantes bacterium]|nr:hypothetical protein [Candidatus Aminicenantes bacterium]